MVFEAFIDELGMIKEALRPTAERFESNYGVYLKPKQHKRFEELSKAEEAGSFILKHPLATGVPSLGIAPAISLGKASRRVNNSMFRGDQGLQRASGRARALRQQESLDEWNAETEREKATQGRQIANSLGDSLVRSIRESKKDREDNS